MEFVLCPRKKKRKLGMYEGWAPPLFLSKSMPMLVLRFNSVFQHWKFMGSLIHYAVD